MLIHTKQRDYVSEILELIKSPDLGEVMLKSLQSWAPNEKQWKFAYNVKNKEIDTVPVSDNTLFTIIIAPKMTQEIIGLMSEGDFAKAASVIQKAAVEKFPVKTNEYTKIILAGNANLDDWRRAKVLASDFTRDYIFGPESRYFTSPIYRAVAINHPEWILNLEFDDLGAVLPYLGYIAVDNTKGYMDLVPKRFARELGNLEFFLDLTINTVSNYFVNSNPALDITKERFLTFKNALQEELDSSDETRSKIAKKLYYSLKDLI